MSQRFSSADYGSCSHVLEGSCHQRLLKMGVKDLLTWVKKTYPEAIVTYSRRWAAPEIAGKRIAIDGTLLTNRYHFATRDGPFGDKGQIIGWYNLISDMRAQGVKPVAIWDERGVREWKAPEARRRLRNRAGHLARRNHEIERASRLGCFRETFSEFKQMTEEEQDLIRSQWEATRFMFTSVSPPEGLSKSKRAKQGKTKVEKEEEDDKCRVKLPTPPATPPLPTMWEAERPEAVKAVNDYALTTIDRVTTMIDALAHLVQEYREHTPPATSQIELKADTEHLGLEHLNEELEEQVARRAKEEDDEKREREEYVKELDETLSELVPPEQFTETRRQTELTRQEGEIINLFLSPIRPPSIPESERDVYATPPSTPSLASVSGEPLDPMEKLNDLIQTAPAVQEIYERALDIPSAVDHENCKGLLRLMGVPVLEAKIPYEAEGLASALAKAGLVDYVGTEDSDVLAYEGPLLRHLSPATSPLSYVSGPTLRRLTQLSPSQYLDFLILLGTDASPRIPKIGPINAFRLIKKYNSIESIITEEPGVVDRISDIEGFMEMVNNARKVFTHLPSVDAVKEQLEEGECDDAEVERWLEEKHGIKLVDRAVESEEGWESEEGASEIGGEAVWEQINFEERRI